MMKVSPVTEYEVEFDNEDIEVIRQAYDIFKTICVLMKKYECDTLEGGYEDCYETFSIKTMSDMTRNLEDFLENIPRKMY